MYNSVNALVKCGREYNNREFTGFKPNTKNAA